MTNLQLTWELEANLGFKMFSPIAEGNFFSCQYCAAHESTPAFTSKRLASDNVCSCSKLAVFIYIFARLLTRGEVVLDFAGRMVLAGHFFGDHLGPERCLRALL